MNPIMGELSADASLAAAAYNVYADVYDCVSPVDDHEIAYWTSLGLWGDVCEIGCGTGRISVALEPTCRLVGVDVSSRMLEIARLRLSTSTRLVEASVESLPFPDYSFDWCIAPRGAISHLITTEERRLGFSEMKRVLRPGGRLVIDVPNVDARYPAGSPSIPTIPRVRIRSGASVCEVSEGFDDDPDGNAMVTHTRVAATLGNDAPRVFEFDLRTARMELGEFDVLADLLGLQLEARHGSFARDASTPQAPRVISQWRSQEPRKAQ